MIEAIEQAPKHLNKNGIFFFPILSLSYSDKIVTFTNSVFNSVEKISSRQWQMPKEMMIHKEELYKLRDNKIISFEEKYGWMLWSTDVYVARDPK